ncbi:MAG: extracellular solute-binding protein [Chloroflexota bacterium]
MARFDSTALTRRSLLARGATTALGGLLAACAPAAAPAAPPPAAPAAGPATKPQWETDWDKMVVAAKQEGAVVVATLAGDGYRKWVESFQQTFPGVEVRQQTFTSGSIWVPKVVEERKGNVFGWDIAMFGASVVAPPLKPIGGLDPLRPLIIQRPDVIDDKNWNGGFNAGWQDTNKELGYGLAGRLLLLAVNTDLVQEGEIKTVEDMLNPKWAGKVVWADVRSGSTFAPMAAVLQGKGRDVVKRLMIDQKPEFLKDTRQILEGIVRGKYAFGSGVTKAVLNPFLDQGVGKNIKLLDIPDYTILAFSDAIWALNKAPHPNAAKLFLNWALTKDGQEAGRQFVNWNSRRADVAGFDANEAPKPGRTYLAVGTEESAQVTDRAIKVLTDLVG